MDERAALMHERAMLAARIGLLKPHSEARLGLCLRMRDITTRLLRLELAQPVPEHAETEGHELEWFQK